MNILYIPVGEHVYTFLLDICRRGIAGSQNTHVVSF